MINIESNAEATPPQNSGTASPEVDDALAVLKEELGACPSAGAGVHSWIFRAAIELKVCCDEEVAYAAIAHGVQPCGREVEPREIHEAIASARNATGKRTNPKWPQKNEALIQGVTASGVTLAEMRKSSPVKVEGLTTQKVIDALFPGLPTKVLICVGKKINAAVTQPKIALWGSLPRMQFIVPSPMRSFRGRKSNGEYSARCLNNTGPRKYIVVESDPVKWSDLSEQLKVAYRSEDNYIARKKDEAAGVLVHLQERAPKFPLVLIVDSAGKSLHGWFNVERAEGDEMVRFFQYAVALGADPATWTRCQFVRMPGGTRDNGKRQDVVYFNPQAEEVA